MAEAANVWRGWPRPKRVSLYAPSGQTTNQNSFGEPALAFAKKADLWASIKPLSGRELWQAQQTQADVTHVIRIRYNPNVTVDATMEIWLGTRRLRITAVLNIEERNRTLELTCQEQPAGA